jgi:hypothetical protein
MTPFSSPKARRLGLMLALCLAIEASAPPPASAWFGWVDKWSGPGPFTGELYEVRVKCFGDSAPEPQEIMRLITEARLATPATFKDSWNRLADALEQVGKVFGLPEASSLADKTRSYAQTAPVNGARDTATTSDPNELLRAAVATANLHARKAATLSGSGIFLSFCAPDKSRRWSIELNMNYWRNKQRDANYAGGEDISMFTFMPSITRNVFENKRFDVLDAGVGVGGYQFRSAGFDDFTGWMIEPRLDLHGPTSWSNHPRSDVRRIASMLSIRLGLMIVGGFEADAFAATGDKAVKIDAEANPTVAVFVNMNSLFTRTLTAPPSLRTGAAAP